MWLAVSSSEIYIRRAEDLRQNSGQWAAYQSRGNCVILAGPGSGKTKILTLKLARMLKEDLQPPRGIACITYNNECARELEERLGVLGVEPSKRVFIGTVHSFSLTQIILPYAKVAQMGLPDNFRVATSAERKVALERAFSRVVGGPENPQDWDLRMGAYRKSVIDRNCKEWKERDPQLAQLVEAYEKELRALGCIDFDDMPLLAIRALQQHPWLRKALLAKYPILIVDEYQDLGLALHHMVMELCFNSGMRLFAVGDVDQSIYGFTGADPESLQQLSIRDDVETIRLRLNYRCGSRIVTASAYALGEERDYEAAQGTGEGLIYFHPQSGSTYREHASFLCSTLLPQIRARLPLLRLGDIGVLYHAAYMGDYVAEAAQAAGIPFLRSDGNALYPRGTRLMRWLEQCAAWSCGGWLIGSPRYSRIVNGGQRLFWDVLSTDEARLLFQQKLIKILWEHRNGSENLSLWLQNLYDSLLHDLLKKCRTLDDEVDILCKFIERCFVSDCKDMSLSKFSGQNSSQENLNLSTLHSSKGREFEVIVMFGMDAGNIPRRKATQRGLVESRRLFYVGLTRAKKEVHFVFSDSKASQFVLGLQERLNE